MRLLLILYCITAKVELTVNVVSEGEHGAEAFNKLMMFDCAQKEAVLFILFHLVTLFTQS